MSFFGSLWIIRTLPKSLLDFNTNPDKKYEARPEDPSGFEGEADLPVSSPQQRREALPTNLGDAEADQVTADQRDRQTDGPDGGFHHTERRGGEQAGGSKEEDKLLDMFHEHLAATDNQKTCLLSRAGRRSRLIVKT